MAKKPKTGRRASPEERAMAASLANAYRVAESHPDGWYYLNPEDEPELRIVIDCNDIDPLLRALESFAEHGTFELLGDIRPFLMRSRMCELNKIDKVPYDEAIAQIAETHHMSESTVKRTLVVKVNP